MSSYLVTSTHGGTNDFLSSKKSRSKSVTSTGFSTSAFISNFSFLSLVDEVGYYFSVSAFGFSIF